MFGSWRTAPRIGRRPLQTLAVLVTVVATTIALAPIGLSSAGATPAVCPSVPSGSWVGTFSGSASGTFTSALDFSAGLTGTISVQGFYDNQAVTGSVSCSQIQFGDVGSVVSFAGSFAADGRTMSGTWQSSSGSGTFRGWYALSGLDMAGYCQSLGFTGDTDNDGEGGPAVLMLGDTVGPNFAFNNWGCMSDDDLAATPVATSGAAPSMSDACAAQNPGATTYAHPLDPNDAFSWSCFPVSLVTSIAGTPSTVTAGSDVQYSVSVRNNGFETVSGVQVADSLPSGTSLVSATAPGACSGTTTVTCSLGTLAPSVSATATLLVNTSSTVPSSGVITDTATASPGSNNTASLDTNVVAANAGSASGYVPPGGSLNTGGPNPALLTLPNTGPGASITITQKPSGNNFCNGPCNGTATFVSDFPGYPDPTHPIDLKLSFTDTGLLNALKDYATSTIYKVRDNQTVGVVVPDCKDNPAWTSAQKFAAAVRRLLRAGTQSGIANPAPCVDSRTITKVSANTYRVTFEILFVSDDGGFSRR